MIGRGSFRRKGGTLGEGIISLNLTPMMDILTSLLFFLMVNMATQSQSMEGEKGLKLPTSVSEKELVVTLTVTVTLDAIKIEDSPVVILKKGRIKKKDIENKTRIVPLYERLVRIIEEKKKKGLEVSKDTSIVLLLADRRLKADTITKVMKTCGMAGIPNFHFGVQKL